VRAGASLTIIDNLNEFYPPEWKENNLEEIRKIGLYRFYYSDICDMNALITTSGLTFAKILI
jgi:hypothetical protein